MKLTTNFNAKANSVTVFIDDKEWLFYERGGDMSTLELEREINRNFVKDYKGYILNMKTGEIRKGVTDGFRPIRTNF